FQKQEFPKERNVDWANITSATAKATGIQRPHHPSQASAATESGPAAFFPTSREAKHLLPQLLLLHLHRHRHLTALLSLGARFFRPVVRTRLPEVHLKSIDFKKFNVTTTPDGLTLDAQSIVSVEVKNPNSNLRMEYDRTRIYVNDVNGGTNLGQVTVPGFMQDKNNVTTLKLTASSEKEILESKRAEELSNGFKNKKLVINVEIESGIGIKSSGWAVGTVEVKVLCCGVTLSQVRQGGAAAPKCRIKILDWVYLN
ncbi:uncharacterized protein, partial [Primulina huaijiensis]|uniref:uncharacterized protein n=1 Tax=Primulina huaijiensis TaxID=1492673 RepID=UPI003CC75150